MSPYLLYRARLLCAHATFVAPCGPFTSYDALMRARSHAQRQGAITRLAALLEA